MAGFNEVQAAVGYDNIMAVLKEHVPTIEAELRYDDDGKRWIGYVKSSDVQGQGVGLTKAEAVKSAYFNWLEVRLSAVNSAPDSSADSDEIDWSTSYKKDVLAEAEKLGMVVRKNTTKDAAIEYIQAHAEGTNSSAAKE